MNLFHKISDMFRCKALMRPKNCLPSIGRGLQEQGDVTSRHVQCGHADHKSNQTDADRPDNVPKLVYY